ncbi:DUF4236 domain-containing protein [Paenibacillus sp. FSL H3-0310]|uniref:DUF4236 domain-containing protein n=1 Tax=Paenibacillus sp. FSL H3-0310 TaxID=2921429 RepID=UPI004040736E
MGSFRFRKSINLGGGVKLNLGKKGVGISAGVKGARVSAGPSGKRATVSLPGTGLSYSKKIGGGKSSHSSRSNPTLNVDEMTPKQIENRKKNLTIFKFIGIAFALLIVILIIFT